MQIYRTTRMLLLVRERIYLQRSQEGERSSLVYQEKSFRKLNIFASYFLMAVAPQ